MGIASPRPRSPSRPPWAGPTRTVRPRETTTTVVRRELRGAGAGPPVATAEFVELATPAPAVPTSGPGTADRSKGATSSALVKGFASIHWARSALVQR